MESFERVELTTFEKTLKQTEHSSAMALALVAQDLLCGKNQGLSKGQKRLDFLYHEFIASFPKFTDPIEGISGLNDYLFTEKKFKSHKGNIHQTDVIFISKVIENRQGTPLALALIYRELAQRIHRPVEIINFPGNFLIKILYNHQLLFLDPSEGGKLLSVADLQTRLSQKFGRGISLSGSFLETAPERQVIVRYLSQLKGAFFETRRWSQLLAVLDMIISLQPDRLNEYKERGLLLYQLGMHNQALGDIQKYVEQSRPSADLDKLKGLLTHLKNPDITPLF